ncbi:MAG: undecaprenyl-diphosphatase UppP [Candidatus Omnitrophica bacterium]|nr:undecaprenyl-diphosphatase UppP [Candidatus Omnitrophota bacterium]
MNWLEAFTLGIVEGVTEFLPISSTGHLILTSKALGLAQTEFLKSFEIAIQLGAILAVPALYGRALLKDKDIWKHVLAAFIPTAILGFLFYKIIKKFLMGNEVVVLWAFLAGGVILILFELFHHEDKASNVKEIRYKDAFLIGIFQSLAMIPGVSRSAATIIGGLALGLKRKTIVEFSFLLAVPTMLAATGLDLLKHGITFTSGDWVLLAIGAVTSFFVANLAMRFLLRYIQNHNFVIFGVYRIAAAIVAWRIIS